MSINRVVISGNLTRDPELRRTQSGLAILSIGVAVNDRRKNNQTGEWEDYANFIDCVLFGTRGEKLSNILTKGMKVAIEGKLRWSQWERDGQKRSKIEVIVDEIDIMTVRNDGGQGGGYQGGGYQGGNQGGYQSSQAASAPATSAPAIDASSSVYDDDIPF